MRCAKQLAASALLFVPTIASADPCTGTSPFADVLASASYCTETEWLKNRNVTTGCGGTNFCPHDFVTRGQMALFLKRLGDVLITPAVAKSEFLGSLPLTLTYRDVCQIDVSAATYPRTFELIGHVSALGGSSSNTIVDVAIRSNLAELARTSMTIDNGWHSNATTSARVSVNAGSARAYTIAVRQNVISSSGAVASGVCTLLLRGQSRAGVNAPFDELAVPVASD
jgi:hypothetical protein